jgi:drug/metabolite transporter (DMT)-like permease
MHAFIATDARQFNLPGLPIDLKLSPNIKGAAWIILGGFFITAMGAITKFMGGGVNAFQITFFRAVFGLMMILPFALAREGLPILKTRCLRLHIARGMVSALGMTAAFYAVVKMSLASATAITFTTPLFITLLAFLVFRERISIHRWGGTMVGFIGVLIIARPDEGTFSLAALVALGGAFCVGAAKLFVKELAAKDKPATILIYLSLTMTVFTAVPACLLWQPLRLMDYGLLVVIGAISLAAQSCVIRGYKAADASAAAPMEYSRLMFATAFGVFLFGELPDGYTLLGAAVIVLSTLYIARREAITKRRQSDGKTAQPAVPVPAGALPAGILPAPAAVRPSLLPLPRPGAFVMPEALPRAV